MYDYLSRGEVTRLVLRLAWYSLCLLAFVAGFVASLASVLGAFDVPGLLVADRVKFARCCCAVLFGLAGAGAWWSIDDALRGAAWLSWSRRLRDLARQVGESR